MQALKDAIDAASSPQLLTVLVVVVLFLAIRFRHLTVQPISIVILLLPVAGFLFSLTDPNFSSVVTKPDNVPIVIMVGLVIFLTWYAMRLAVRNDQVLAALRLYLLHVSHELARGAECVAQALEALAARAGDVPLPGYTHQQQAMPSSVELWAGGFAAELRDDAQGLLAVQRRASKNPLGSAAGYGVPLLPIDRESTRAKLGMTKVHEPVTAVQLSRGKAEAQLLFEVALLLQDLGRLAAELVLFSTSEFGFVELDPALTTGSSIMPQKRNPDLFELVRGRTAVGQSCLQEALAITAKLPSGYHRDLQLLKSPLFRGIDTALETSAVMAHALEGVRFRPDRIRLDPSLHAAEEAYRLVLDQGIPFREAYRRVAEKYR